MRRDGLLRLGAAIVLVGLVLAGGFLPAAFDNDRFADSIELEGASGWVHGINVGAGVELDEPAHAGFEPKSSVWWSWTAVETGRLTLFTHGSSFDTRLGLYTGETVGSLTEVGSNDDAGGSIRQSLVSVTVEGGARVHIAVDGFEVTGSIVLSWHWESKTDLSPANNRFVDRAELIGESGQLISTNEAASKEPQEPFHAGKEGWSSVWWTWEVPDSGVAVLHTGGSTFDTLLGVYTGQEIETLEPVAGNDGEGVSSYVSFPVTEGSEYHIAVDGFRSASGIFVLSWEILSDCETPSTPVGPMPPDGTQGAGETVKLEWGRTAAARQNVIYGEDDRLDFFEVEDAALLRAAESTVAIVRIDDLTDNGDGTYSIPEARFGGLCPDEPYADQPNPARCTGFLVGPDLIATAGHCLTTTTDCASNAFVFGFRMEGPDEPVLTFPRSQVYFCDGILGRELDGDYDWAVVRLDRSVLDHDPLEIRQDGMIDDGQGLVVIGHPSGWPVKIAGGARVRENLDEAFFTANLDAYEGNSGSPVLNANTLLVEGLLWGGEVPDFVVDDVGNCLRSKVCPDEECSGEFVTRTTNFAELVAASPSPTTYEVYLGRCDDVVPPRDLEFRGETGEKELTVRGLEPDVTYCWKIVAKRQCGQAAGPLWTFTTGTGAREFVRGDVNDDGFSNVTDAVNVLNFLFSGTADSPPCDSAADINDDGTINVADPVALLNYLFSDGAEVPPPTVECGDDPTPDGLSCEVFEPCQ